MSPTLRSIRAELQRLAAEVSPRVHLAAPAARDVWTALEAELEQFERKAELLTDRVGDHLVEQGMELQTRLRRLRARVWHDLEEPTPSP